MVVLFLTLSLPLFVSSAKTNIAQGVISKQQIIQKFPVRLKIPKISVDSLIEQVGLTADGAIGAPKGPINAAWYNLSPIPGASGSSIIDGHFGWKDGKQAVFDNLAKLVKGDRIFVENDKKETITFVVREVKSYGEHDNPSGVFTSNDGKAHLNLITCGGIYNKKTKSYSNRIVVFADKII